jgi:uncharacterized protein YndB with AHSA1/START domain
MAVTELNRIERSVWIRAPRARVWRALTDSREFARWFGVEMTDPFQAGKIARMTAIHPSVKGYVFPVEVVEMVPEEKFSWRWHPGRPDAGVDYAKEPTTLVEFRLEDADGGTRLTVTETGFEQISLARRASVFQDNEGGWTYQMKQVSEYVHQTP